MVPHSQNVAYSDGSPHALWKDGERIISPGWRLDDDFKQCAVLLVTPAWRRGIGPGLRLFRRRQVLGGRRALFPFAIHARPS